MCYLFSSHQVVLLPNVSSSNECIITRPQMTSVYNFLANVLRLRLKVNVVHLVECGSFSGNCNKFEIGVWYSA